MKKLLLLLLMTLLSLNNLYACSCKKDKSIKESYESKLLESIVHGKVLSKAFVSLNEIVDKETLDSIKVKHNKKENFYTQKDFLKIELKVIEKFKGKTKSDIITIYTHSQSSACGYPWFKKGREYLVYATSKIASSYSLNNKNETIYWTYNCLRTKEYDSFEAQQLTKLIN